jgi:hypothetical protein
LAGTHENPTSLLPKPTFKKILGELILYFRSHRIIDGCGFHRGVIDHLYIRHAPRMLSELPVQLFRSGNGEEGTVDAGYSHVGWTEIDWAYENGLYYELALDPDQLPEGASVGGQTPDLEREISPNDLVLVKVRYKHLDATADNPAYEVSSALSPEDLGDPDQDLAWAGAVAYFAEILKSGPYMTEGMLPELENVLLEQTGRDDDRDEFIQLFESARPLIEALTAL